jgi:uncharacterized alpha-E superfamily protein
MLGPQGRSSNHRTSQDAGITVLSRVADSIFWMCRYIERAENIARFINVNWHMMLDAAAPPSELQWEPLINVTGDRALFFERHEVATRENVLRFLTFDKAYPNSIRSCLSQARENARSIREIIPQVIWEQVNTFHLAVDGAACDEAILDQPYAFLTDVIRESNQFIGLTMTTMLHDEGWHFCRMGRMLERADKTSRILDVKYFYLLPSTQDIGSPLDHIQWSSLLMSTSALQAYRQIYGTIQPAKVVEMLLLHRDFPRAIRYCVDRIQSSLLRVSGAAAGTHSNEAERLCGQLAADLAYLSVEMVIADGLHEYVDALQGRLNGIGAAVFDTFFDTRRAPLLQLQSMQ